MAYNTEQKKAILDLLAAHPERQFTAEEIAQALSGEVGVSTVYRRMPDLVKSGEVKRFEVGRKSVYQAVTCAHRAEHLHMKCVECGRLLHLSHEISEQISGLISGSCAFSVNEGDTVLFGKCGECK